MPFVLVYFIIFFPSRLKTQVWMQWKGKKKKTTMLLWHSRRFFPTVFMWVADKNMWIIGQPVGTWWRDSETESLPAFSTISAGLIKDITSSYQPFSLELKLYRSFYFNILWALIYWVFLWACFHCKSCQLLNLGYSRQPWWLGLKFFLCSGKL